MITLAIAAILFAFSVPIYQLLQNRNDLDIASNTIAQDYRRAQLLSQAVYGDTTWGVKIQTGHVTIFSGNNYETRSPDSDEDLTISPSITVSGDEETVFAKLTGFPQTTGTLTLTSVNNETRTLTINEKGIVSY